MTSRADDDAVSTLRAGGGTVLLTGGDTVPEVLDYRSMLVGAALARQQMMTESLSDYGRHQKHHSSHQYQQHLHPQHPHLHHSRRFTPYVITNDFIARPS